MPHSFFFSYSSVDDRTSLGLMRLFFDLLTSALQTVHGGRVDKPFFAPQNIQAGEKWSMALNSGLNSSQVLVCLQSASYYESEWCGKELELFLRRRKQVKLQGGTPPDCIIPVLWYSCDAPRQVPKVFHAAKPTESDAPIGEDRLFEAMLRESTPNRTMLFALRLAGRISNLLKQNQGDRQLPSLPGPGLHDIPSAFDLPAWPVPDLDAEQGTGPESVTFAYPAVADPQHLPFAPPLPNAVTSAAVIAKSNEWIFQGIEYGQNAFWDEHNGFWARIGRALGWNSPVVLMLTEALAAAIPGERYFHDVLSDKRLATMVLSPNAGIPPGFPEDLRGKVTFSNRDRFDEILTARLKMLRLALGSEPTPAIPRATEFTTLPG
jgi:hypothetical protein